MIEAARERAKNRQAPIAFEVAAAEQLPFASERFDVIVAVTILCFVPNAAPVFREMARVLRARWPAYYWRAWQMELLGSRAPHQGVERLGAVASRQVPHPSRARETQRRRRPYRRGSPRCNLLPAVAFCRPSGRSLGSSAGPADDNWCSVHCGVCG